jgi:ribosomal protein S11
MTAWNDFVAKIYHEKHDKDSTYTFKQALKDASARKKEMGTPNLAMGVKKPTKKSRKARKSMKKGIMNMIAGKMTRRRRRMRR